MIHQRYPAIISSLPTSPAVGWRVSRDKFMNAMSSRAASRSRPCKCKEGFSRERGERILLARGRRPGSQAKGRSKRSIPRRRRRDKEREDLVSSHSRRPCFARAHAALLRRCSRSRRRPRCSGGIPGKLTTTRRTSSFPLLARYLPLMLFRFSTAHAIPSRFEPVSRAPRVHVANLPRRGSSFYFASSTLFSGVVQEKRE